jgi:hypothetical protein
VALLRLLAVVAVQDDYRERKNEIRWTPEKRPSKVREDETAVAVAAAAAAAAAADAGNEPEPPLAEGSAASVGAALTGSESEFLPPRRPLPLPKWSEAYLAEIQTAATTFLVPIGSLSLA